MPLIFELYKVQLKMNKCQNNIKKKTRFDLDSELQHLIERVKSFSFVTHPPPFLETPPITPIYSVTLSNPIQPHDKGDKPNPLSNDVSDTKNDEEIITDKIIRDAILSHRNSQLINRLDLQLYSSQSPDYFTLHSKIDKHFEPVIEKPFMEISEEVNNIADLIKVTNKYEQYLHTHRFGISLDKLIDLRDPLNDLETVVGMVTVKEQIIDQILSSIQSLYDKDHRFHTIIQGPSGVGKTMLAKIIGRIYLEMGIIKSTGSDKKLKFKIARRSDLVGKFLGHTAVQTQEFINKCDGGVLFIDEVYSLGNHEKKDSFSKECIDTLNMNLTEKKNFVCIVAGYPDEIEECFFSYNPGLRRRFNFVYTVNSYTPKELSKIFLLKVKGGEWNTDEEVTNKWLASVIDQNKNLFPHYGGDIETWLLKCQTTHGRRVFGKDPSMRRILTKNDITSGLELFKISRKEENGLPESVKPMYV